MQMSKAPCLGMKTKLMDCSKKGRRNLYVKYQDNEINRWDFSLALNIVSDFPLQTSWDSWYTLDNFNNWYVTQL